MSLKEERFSPQNIRRRSNMVAPFGKVDRVTEES